MGIDLAHAEWEAVWGWGRQGLFHLDAKWLRFDLDAEWLRFGWGTKQLRFNEQGVEKGMGDAVKAVVSSIVVEG